MAEPAAAAAIARARDTVAEELRRHKRQVRYHREQTQELKKRLERLEAQLAGLGVRLEVNTQPDQGGHSGSVNGGEAETV